MPPPVPALFDQPVEPPEAPHLGDERRAAFLGRDVGGDARHAELLDELIEAILPARTQDDVAVALDQAPRDAEADARAAARDERDGPAHADAASGFARGSAPARQARAATRAVSAGAAP